VNVPNKFVLACGLAAASMIFAAAVAPQAQAAPGARSSEPQTATTSRSLKALDYRRAGKSVVIYFVPTDQGSGASGSAKVATKTNGPLENQVKSGILSPFRTALIQRHCALEHRNY